MLTLLMLVFFKFSIFFGFLVVVYLKERWSHAYHQSSNPRGLESLDD